MPNDDQPTELDPNIGTIGMVRRQIQLTPEQDEKLQRLSRKRRLSTAALVREAVDRLSGDDRREEVIRRALAAVGKLSGGPSDVSVEHDKYLAEAFKDW